MLRSATDLLDSHVGWTGWDTAAHGQADAITIPDAHLLFSGDFKRAGTDLILSDNAHKFVVHDYFRGEHRPTLLSPDGARLTPEVVEALTGHGDYAQAGPAQNASAPIVVGRVAKIEGSATIVRNGVAITVDIGDAVLKGDVLQTGAGVLGVTFTDGSTLSLTANSRLMVNDFVYEANGSANSEILNLVQGSLSFISGEVAHSGGDMKITTPVATMGIRGTVGGVSEASDGTVSFFVVESATGAVVTDGAGHVLFQVVQDGPLIRVRPAGPLQVIAEEVQKSPQELAAELAILQQIVSTQAVGQQIIQHFQDLLNNQGPHSTGTDHTQIEIDIPLNAILGTGTGITATGAPNSDHVATVKTTDQNGVTTTTEVPLQQQQPNPPPDNSGKTVFWTGAGGSTDPSDATNWSPGTPVPQDDVLIGSDANNNPVLNAIVVESGPFTVHSLTMSNGANLFASEITTTGDLVLFGDAPTEIIGQGSLAIDSVGGNLFVQATAGDGTNGAAGIFACGPLSIGPVAGSFTVEAGVPAGQCTSADAEIRAAGRDLTIGTIGGSFLLSATIGDGGSATAEIVGRNVSIGNVGHDFTVTGSPYCLSSNFAEISATCGDLTIGTIAGDFLNQGLIDADNGVLSIGAVGGTFVNDGIMRAYELQIAPGGSALDNDGKILVSGGTGGGGDDSVIGVDVNNTGLIKVTDGAVLDFTGAVHNTDCGLILADGCGSAINFDCGWVDNCATIKADYDGSINFYGHVHNAGTIEAKHGGEIDFSGVVHNVDCGLILASGCGSAIGFDCGWVDNCATIKATYDGGIDFNDSVWNSGTIVASHGGEIDFHGSVHNSGSIDAASCGNISFETCNVDNCGIIAANSDGTINFDHWVGGNGTLAIGGGTIELASGTCNYIQFCGPDGTLKLDDPTASIGQISGFGPGDSIDLVNTDDVSIVSYTVDTGNNTGVLELSSDHGYIFLSFSGDNSLSNFSNYSAANFHITDDGNGGAAVVEAPVIDVLNQHVDTDLSDVTTVTGFSVVVPFAGDNLFTISAQAGHGTLAFVDSALNTNPLSDTISEADVTLTQINDALFDGIVYTPNDINSPEIDNVQITIDDNHGSTETLNLIFRAAETQAGATFEATTGNDVIYGTQHPDNFIFQPDTIGGNDVIVGFAPEDMIVFTGENVTVSGYEDDGNSGVLDLLLHPVDGSPGSRLLLTLDGHYDAGDFVTLFNGSETVLLDRPSPSPVGAGGGAGVWANANGGDWGRTGNWGNDALPGSFDPVDLTDHVGGTGSYTATYDGSVDGIPGVGATTVESLEVDLGVTFDIYNQGALFLSGDFHNDGTVVADRGEIAGSGGGSNSNNIVLLGDDTATGGLFLNGTFNNTGLVFLEPGGSAQFGAVTGNGLLTIDGGALTIDPLGHASSGDTVDTNDIAFDQPNSTLILGGLGQVTGSISGFAFSDAIFFTGEQMTVAGYDAATGVLDLHAANGGGDVFLTFTGSYDASEFVALYDGSETVLLDRPSPSPTGGSGGAGLWANASGGDWGTVTNWGNGALPDTFDPVELTNVIGGNPASYTATYDGGIDGIPGIGATSVESLEVDQGVTFDIFNEGALFLSHDFQNDGTVIANRGEIAGSGNGSNTGTITLSGDDTATGSVFISGTFVNTNHVLLKTGGSAQFGAVTGGGVMSIAGGTLEIDPLGRASSSDIADTNAISFEASKSTLLLGGQGQINGNITGFGVSDSIGFLNEQVTITSYVDDGGHGVLTLHLHSLDGGGDTDLTLNLQGSYTRADFLVVHGGQDTFLLEKPPGLVQASLNGVWSNAAGGDWGTASNWHNDVVPGSTDDILLSTPAGHTVTFNGAIDGIPGYGIGGANSLTVGSGVTFQVTNHGQLFFDDTLTNGGAIDVVNSGLSFGGDGTNTNLITIEGTTGVISSTFDMDNGALANSGTVDAKARGWATFGSVTGSGILKVDGGVIQLGAADTTSAQTVDTNEIDFTAPGGMLMLSGQGQISGHISGFGASDTLSFLDEQVTVTGYSSFTGILQVHLHSLDGLGDSDLSLTFDGHATGSFSAQFNGLDTLVYFNPILAPVHGGAGAGIWSNAQGGDWGVAGNWQNNAVPDYSDDIVLNTPVNHTVTFNGSIDGQAGFAQASSLTVGANVTFQVSKHGELFFTGALANSGTVDVVNSGLSFGGNGTNSGLITVEGTTGAISSTFDMDNGTLANDGTVDAKARGWATFGAVTGSGTLKVDGGVITLGGAGTTSSDTTDTNAILFAAAGGLLMLDGQGAVAGHISGFDATDNVSFIDEQVSVVSYDSISGVLQLHLHSLDGLGDHNVSLTFDGLSTGNFTTQFDGLDSLLYFNPVPAPVHGGAGAGVWSNVQGGDWGVTSNWQNRAVPGYSDDITLNSPVGHTVTFNGAIDGQQGFASAGALTVASGVTFDVTHHGSLFFTGDLHNDGFIDVLDSGLSFAGVGVNTGTIDVHGTSGFISSTLDIDNGALNNTGTVIAGPHGEASFGSVTGSGVLVIDGGAIGIDGADANDVQFSTAHSGTLLLSDPSQFTGTISGFAPVTTIGALPTAPEIAIEGENVAVSSYVDHGNHTGTLHLSDGSSLNFDGDYAAANFAAQFDGLATNITDQGPVISAAHQTATDNGGSTTVSGLSIADLFQAGSQFAFTMTAGDGTLALANSGDALNSELSSNGSNGTLSATASLSDINTALSHGFVYTPNAPEPPTDNVSIKIQDVTGGAIDELNLVFNQGGSGPDVTLTGTNGKDVVYATGFNDTLTGGASSDMFVFREFGNASTPNTDTITDFNVFQDYLNFDQAHFATTAALLAATSDVGGHAVIAVDAHNTIALTNVTTAQLAAHQDHILLAA